MRDFIQETIDTLHKSSNRIQDLYTKFQAGEITQDQFEEDYKSILSNVREDCEAEYYYPNNLCQYKHLS